MGVDGREIFCQSPTLRRKLGHSLEGVEGFHQRRSEDRVPVDLQVSLFPAGCHFAGMSGVSVTCVTS